jgi:hypothetical protein
MKKKIKEPDAKAVLGRLLGTERDWIMHQIAARIISVMPSNRRDCEIVLGLVRNYMWTNIEKKAR